MPLSDGMNARPVIDFDAAANGGCIFKFAAQWCGANFETAEPIQPRAGLRGRSARQLATDRSGDFDSCGEHRKVQEPIFVFLGSVGPLEQA